MLVLSVNLQVTSSFFPEQVMSVIAGLCFVLVSASVRRRGRAGPSGKRHRGRPLLSGFCRQRSRFEHENQGQSCFSPSGAKEKVLKSASGFPFWRLEKQHRRASPYRTMKPGSLYDRPGFSIQAPCLRPSPGAAGAQLRSCGISPHPRPHSFLWCLAYGTSVKQNQSRLHKAFHHRGKEK